jgi:Thermopsin
LAAGLGEHEIWRRYPERMVGSKWLMIAPVALVSILILSSMVVLATPIAPSNPTSPVTFANSVSSVNAPSSPPVSSSVKVLGINSVLAAAVKAKENKILADGGNLSNFHPPNLHQAPALSATQGVVTPLYSVAPAPLGVAYYGESNTTGTIQGTVVNTTSLAGTWNTTDPIGTAAELFDTSSGNAAGSFGAQLNTVLVNVTIKGDTSFANSHDINEAPTFCPANSFYLGNLPGNACPNEFWLQNYIQYTESTHSLTISNEIWNFSNPTADWASSQSGGTNTLAGFGSVESGEVYQGPSSGTITIPAPYTFSLALYINYTQGPCRTDSPAGVGIGSCPAAYGTTYPVNELFMNYTVRSSTGARVCPNTIPTGRVCGEDDDVFFNSLAPGATQGVPLYGPCPTYPVGCTTSNARIGSATIQANGTGYDPVGLTNDFEFDYGIGSDDGATNNIVYQDGAVGVNYCQNANAAQGANGGIKCSSYSATPAAVDYGGETGETSTGEMAYWAPQGTAGPGPTLLTGAATPVTHLVTGPSLLVGLWNMTGSTYTGSKPYPAYTGGEPLSYQNIAPANAWVGIAQDLTPGVTVTSQFYFQVAPTFGFFSYWKGSGGAPTPTTLGPNLYLPTGWYTIEVLLSGYAPVVEQVDLTAPTAPDIHLSPSASTGAYTPDWAFSNADLANLSVSASNVVPTGSGTSLNPYIISAPSPTVGTVTSVSGGQVVIGQAGSVSWLFSNLNDYLFTQWIGAFINSTTAVTQFNPAPSFTMNYPSWQFPALAEFNVPTTNGFQYYLLNTQNLAVIGATHLYAWGNSEATTIYSFVVNNGANDLIAGNTFAISNRGLEFINGGTTSTFTINGNVVTPVLGLARNIVWGNTFAPDPQTSFTGLEPFTTQDALTVSEAFDRVYNNDFGAYSSTINATANAGATDSTFWNATCQVGYNPLSAPSYPGPTVCEPLSYAQSIDGYTMSGSIVASHYQGGNFWAAYGNEANPYANIPFKARTTSLTTPTAGEIASTVFGFAGDYAPLITTTVYDPTYTETGLPSSATTTTFAVHILGASGTPLLWVNTSATSATPAGCSPSTVCVKFYVPNGTYEFLVPTTTISAVVYYPDPATGVFTVAGAGVAPTAISFGVGHVVTFTESGLPSGVTWYVNVSGQAPLSTTTSGAGGTTLAITLSNGVYPYTVASSDKRWAPTYASPVTVSGSAVAVPVTFTLFTFGVTFSESGLPSGLTWQVSVGGSPMSLTTDGGTDSLTFAEANGTFAFVITDNSGWHQSTLPYSGGNVVVNGGPVTEPTLVYTAVTYTATISESTLPSGLSWSITLNGVTQSTTTDGLTDTLTWTGLANDSYSYTIADVSGWHQGTLPYSGTIAVNGGSSAIDGTGNGYANTLVYSQVTYTVTISESTLPSGESWSITLNGVTQSTTTDGSTDTLTWTGLANGSYSYSIADISGWHQGTLPYSGTISVNGGTGAIDGTGIGYANTLVYDPVTYSVTFSESGLPSGLTWQVTVHGVTKSLTTDGATDSLSFTVRNGTYSYSIADNSGWHQTTLPYSGSVTVSGASVTEATLVYAQVTYSVTFSESGLPSGLTWKVTVNGVTKSLVTNGATDSVTWTGLANNTYAYSVKGISGWHQSTLPYTGSVTVNGAPVTESTLVYTEVTYSVTFSESGLPSGLTWQVTVFGITKSLTTDGGTDSLTWSGLLNGTYAYSIAGNPGWHDASRTYSGTVTVRGNSVTDKNRYTKVTYSVTFSESGLPSGLTWRVTVNGVSKSLTTDGGTDSLTWTGLANNTYAYTIHSVSGWVQTTLPSSGTVVVNGASVMEATLRYSP